MRPNLRKLAAFTMPLVAFILVTLIAWSGISRLYYPLVGLTIVLAFIAALKLLRKA
jgi:hypothetical protein